MQKRVYESYPLTFLGELQFRLLHNIRNYACRRVQNSRVGNVFEDRLADLWVCEMEQYREYDRFKKCAKCELMPWCRGCPAVASGAHGDFYDIDPQCWKTKNDITGEVL